MADAVLGPAAGRGAADRPAGVTGQRLARVLHVADVVVGGDLVLGVVVQAALARVAQ